MSEPEPLPALDLSEKEFFFSKEGAINDLLKPKGGNDQVSGRDFFKVADKVSKLTELGASPVLFLDSSGLIRLSVAHWKPDDHSNMYVATLDQDDLLEFSLFEVASKPPSAFFLEGVNFEKFFKSSNLERALGLVSISGHSKGSSVSIPGVSSVVLPPSLLSVFSDLDDPIKPVAFLEKLCSTLKEREITVTDKGNVRKSISQHIKDLVTFGIVACSADNFATTSFLDPKDVEEITFKRVEEFLEAVRDEITQDDDYYDEDHSDVEHPTDPLPDASPAQSHPSRPSISPSLLGSPSIRNAPRTETAAIVQLTNVLSTFVTSTQESLANNNMTKKKSFFEKDERANIKEQLLYVQSWNGREPAASLDPETEKFYKLSPTAQASDLSSNGMLRVSSAVCQSLQFAITTSKNLHESPRGLSIFALTIQKDCKLDIALLTQGLSDHVVKASFSAEELKSLAVSSIEIPSNVFHLMEILRGFKLFLTKFTGPNSYILERYSEFVKSIELLQQELYRSFEIDGPAFMCSFLQAVNGKIATFVNLCKDKVLPVLSFDEIVSNLRESRFMNTFRVDVPEPLRQSTETTKVTTKVSEKKRSSLPNWHSDRDTKKRSNRTETATSPYTDLLWPVWKEKANGKVRKENDISLPIARGKQLCPRFYFGGSCSFEDCLSNKGHFTNLNSSEKASIKDLKKKCLQCQSANMKAIDRLYKSHGMKSKCKVDEKQEAADIEDNVMEDTRMESSEAVREENDPDERVVKLIQNILDAPSSTFKKSPFIFENTKKARVHNSKILEKFDFDFKLAMNSIEKSVIHPGSEFRDSELLEPLLKNHPDWKILKEIMDLGVDLGLDPSKIRDEETRLKDFDNALQKGNSGTMKDSLAKETVAKNQEKEVSYGRSIPITIECARKLKNGSLTPLGCAVQWTINELNEKVVKRRTTHNLSFEWLSGLSVNSSVDPDCLEEIIYGHCLYRCIHIMHQMRLKYPRVAILMSKFDIDAAFRRLHSWCEHAPLYMATLPSPDCEDELTAFLDVRMPFGANQGPGKFGIVSETATDIANYLMKNKAWSPEKLKSSFSKQIPDKKLLDESVEFGQAFPLLAEIQDHKTYWDVFVDDLINLTLNEMGLEGKAKEAAAIALELLFRPRVESEEVNRNTILKWEKLLAEGRQEEVKVILGWLINSRIWRIFIPDDKAKRWMMDIDDLIEKGRNKERVYRQELESIIGKANEAAFIARELRFFLSKLRFRLKCAITHGSAFLRLQEVQDLQLIKRMIEHLSTKGRSLNHVSVTLPSLFLKQDASTSVGMGGFNDLGFAWKIVLHPEILELFHINSLEHLAGVTNIWMAVLLLHLNGDGNGMKFLDQSDNMTAIAWMIRSSYFTSEDKADARIREIISRKLADIMGAADIGTYLQHIPGVENIIADILSRSRRNFKKRRIRHPDCGRTGSDYLVDKIARGRDDSDQGVTQKTKEKDSEHFRKWRCFTTRSGLDIFLLDQRPERRIQILSAFAFELRYNRFGKKALDQLRGDTVEISIDNVCKTFLANGFPSPQLGPNGKKALLLCRQFRKYKDDDPPTKRQPALPIRLFFFITNLLCTNDKELAIQQLIIIAFFWMMRSCEYSETPEKEKKRTKIVELRDISFIVKGEEVPWNGNIDGASEVLITFRMQKNDERMETISASRTRKILCPCRAMISLVKRIRPYKRTNGRTQINAYFHNGELQFIRNTEILNKLKIVVKIMGKVDLGLNPNDVGTHSLRASYALILALMGAPDSKIMLLGRWKSDAFLKYIKRQIIKLRDNTAFKATRALTSNFKIKMR